VGVGAGVGTSVGVGVAVGFGWTDWAVVEPPQETRRALIRNITPNKTNRCTRECAGAERALFSGKCHIADLSQREANAARKWIR
jgi:hypothetical protein